MAELRDPARPQVAKASSGVAAGGRTSLEHRHAVTVASEQDRGGEPLSPPPMTTMRRPSRFARTFRRVASLPRTGRRYGASGGAATEPDSGIRIRRADAKQPVAEEGYRLLCVILRTYHADHPWSRSEASRWFGQDVQQSGAALDARRHRSFLRIGRESDAAFLGLVRANRAFGEHVEHGPP